MPEWAREVGDAAVDPQRGPNATHVKAALRPSLMMCRKGMAMRRLMTISLILTGTTASAHPGHPEVLGHPDPWIIGAGIGAIIIAGLLGKAKGKKRKGKPA